MPKRTTRARVAEMHGPGEPTPRDTRGSGPSWKENGEARGPLVPLILTKLPSRLQSVGRHDRTESIPPDPGGSGASSGTGGGPRLLATWSTTRHVENKGTSRQGTSGRGDERSSRTLHLTTGPSLHGTRRRDECHDTALRLAIFASSTTRREAGPGGRRSLTFDDTGWAIRRGFDDGTMASWSSGSHNDSFAGHLRRGVFQVTGRTDTARGGERPYPILPAPYYTDAHGGARRRAPNVSLPRSSPRPRIPIGQHKVRRNSPLHGKRLVIDNDLPSMLHSVKHTGLANPQVRKVDVQRVENCLCTESSRVERDGPRTFEGARSHRARRVIWDKQRPSPSSPCRRE